jgi:phage recombination protein Bet
MADNKALAAVADTVKVLSKVSFDDVTVTRDDVRNYLCKDATDKEIYMAMGIMASYKLNPFKREIHLIKFKDSPAEVIVGYESYLKRAERTGKLKGWKAGISEDKKQAWVKIWRADWDEPFEWTVELAEFDKKRATWTAMPTHMGKKVAIAQGFRLAFPDELGGMPYTSEEHDVFDISKRKAVEAETVPIAQPQRKSEAAAPAAPAAKQEDTSVTPGMEEAFAGPAQVKKVLDEPPKFPKPEASPKFDRSKMKPHVAKYHGKCYECGGDIATGDQMFYDIAAKTGFHKECPYVPE